MNKPAYWPWLLLLILIGFWLRFTFLIGNLYYIDEYYSMLAVKMIAEKGLPIFPSGLFYEHGILYSYLAGLLVALVGFSEQMARWPVLFISVLTIAAYYHLGSRLFDSRLTGLIAAALATFDVFLLKWGAWARMYTLAHFFVLLTVGWFLLSTFKQPTPRRRYICLIFLAGALFSHSLTFMLLPPMMLLLLMLTLTYRRAWLTQPNLWRQIGLAVLIMGSALALAGYGQVESLISWQNKADEAVSMPTGFTFLNGFFFIKLDLARSLDFLNYFRQPEYAWLFWIIIIGLFMVGLRLVRRQITFADIAFIFLIALLLMVVFQLGTLVKKEWQQQRYLLFMGTPFFLLLAAESLSRLTRTLADVWLILGQYDKLPPLGKAVKFCRNSSHEPRLPPTLALPTLGGGDESPLSLRGVGVRVSRWLNSNLRQNLTALLGIAGGQDSDNLTTLPFLGRLRGVDFPMHLPAALPIAIILLMSGRPAWDIAHVRATGDYRDAFEYVQDNLQPGDRIMSEQPAIAHIYLEQNDYYANQTTAKVLDAIPGDNQFTPVDRYTGSPLVDTVDQFNHVLADEERVWLVVGDKHLFIYYEPFFRQQMFAQMELIHRAGASYVFRSWPNPTPVPAEPDVPLSVNFDHRILLGGYSFDPTMISPSGRASIGLYWRPIGDFPTRPLKVFVHLRDEQNQTVTQADHFLLQGTLDGKRWYFLQAQNEWLRDAAHLQLPLPLEQGRYRLYIGFYDPETFERVPIINDESGEHAAVIALENLNVFGGGQ